MRIYDVTFGLSNGTHRTIRARANTRRAAVRVAGGIYRDEKPGLAIYSTQFIRYVPPAEREETVNA